MRNLPNFRGEPVGSAGIVRYRQGLRAEVARFANKHGSPNRREGDVSLIAQLRVGAPFRRIDAY